MSTIALTWQPDGGRPKTAYVYDADQAAVRAAESVALTTDPEVTLTLDNVADGPDGAQRTQEFRAVQILVVAVRP